jgi:hypothetical protein
VFALVASPALLACLYGVVFMDTRLPGDAVRALAALAHLEPLLGLGSVRRRRDWTLSGACFVRAGLSVAVPRLRTCVGAWVLCVCNGVYVVPLLVLL